MGVLVAGWRGRRLDRWAHRLHPRRGRPSRRTVGGRLVGPRPPLDVGRPPPPAGVPGLGGVLHRRSLTAADGLLGDRLQDGLSRQAPAPGDAAPLPLRRPTPHTVVDAVAEGVLEAGGLDRAVGADAAGDLHADAVAGEERRGRLAPAPAPRHPLFGHGTQPPRSPSISSTAPRLWRFPSCTTVLAAADDAVLGKIGPEHHFESGARCLTTTPTGNRKLTTRCPSRPRKATTLPSTRTRTWPAR